MERTGRKGAAKEAALVMLCLALVTTPPNVAVAQASNPDSAMRANAQRAADLCSDYIHASLLTPQEAAEEAVRRGFTRRPDVTQTDGGYMMARELVDLSSPSVWVQIEVYNFPSGRTSSCSVFPDLDHAGLLELQTDYVTRDPSNPFRVLWRGWSRRAGPTFVTWERPQCMTGSTLSVSVTNGVARALGFRRDDRPGVSLDEISSAYCL